MKFLPVASSAVTLAAATMFTSSVGAVPPKHHELAGYKFEQYQIDFGKHYATPEEEQHRKKIFEDRLSAIRKHNSNPSHSYKQGVNQFTDGTEPFKGLARSGGTPGKVCCRFRSQAGKVHAR